MDRIAKLVQASGDLRRQLWASLPLQVRLGDFFTRLAVTTTDAFGEAMYAEFLKRGVQGIPDDYKNRARKFGKISYRSMMSRFRHPDFVEEVMMDFMVRFLSSGSQGIREGSSLRDAEQYVYTGLRRQGLNALKKKREVSDIFFSDGEEGRHELSVFDEDTVEQQLKRQLPKLQSKLRAIHPDAPLYVKLSLIDGYSDKEIVGDVANGVESLLKHPYSSTGKPLTPSLWHVGYKAKILKVLQNNFDYLQVGV
jgi:DNA-directed RNA polymerase specialized sigma24 family protein